jgi:hypothetical protein
LSSGSTRKRRVISLPEREGEDRDEWKGQLGWVLELKKLKRWELRRRTKEMESRWN